MDKPGSSKSGIYDYLMHLVDKADDEVLEELAGRQETEEVGRAEIDEVDSDDYDELEDIIIESELQNTIKNIKGIKSDAKEDEEMLNVLGIEKDKIEEKSARVFDMKLFDSAIEYNRSMKKMLQKLECFLVLQQREFELNPTEADRDDKIYPRSRNEFYNQYGAPYFRDGVFPSPPNAEQQLKASVCRPLYVDRYLYDSWNSMELSHLEDAIRDFFVTELFKEHGVTKKNMNENIFRKVKFLRNCSLKELASKHDVQKLDWESISNKMPSPHFSGDCEILWNIYLAPSVNKSLWSNEENTKLLSIAKEYNLRNWEVIAEKLNTGRSGYLCFMQYRRELSVPNNNWSAEENSLLYDVVQACKVGEHINWVKVTYYLDSHNAFELCSKFTKHFSMQGEDNRPRRGRFLKLEDKVIIQGLAKGLKTKEIVKLLPSRNYAQTAARAKHLAQFNRRIGGWTPDEDRQLVELVKELGTDWTEIAKRMGKRTRVQIRQHYLYVQKVLEKKTGSTFESYRTVDSHNYKKSSQRTKRFYNRAAREEFSFMKKDKEEDELIKYFTQESAAFRPRQSISTTFDANRSDIISMLGLLGARLSSSFPPRTRTAESQDKSYLEYLHEAHRFIDMNTSELFSLKPLSNEVTILPPNVLTFNAYRNISTRLISEKNVLLRGGDLDLSDNQVMFKKASEDWFKRLLVLFAVPFAVQGINFDQLKELLAGRGDFEGTSQKEDK